VAQNTLLSVYAENQQTKKNMSINNPIPKHIMITQNPPVYQSTSTPYYAIQINMKLCLQANSVPLVAVLLPAFCLLTTKRKKKKT
jgi:hypothetical protein